MELSPIRITSFDFVSVVDGIEHCVRAVHFRLSCLAIIGVAIWRGWGSALDANARDTVTEIGVQTRRMFAAADLFQIIGIAYEFPKEDFARGVGEGSVVSDALSCLSEMGCPDVSALFDSKGLERAASRNSIGDVLLRMRREHSRLFANPARPVVWIYETMFCFEGDGGGKRPDAFVSPECLHLEQMMRESGVEVSEANKQPVDYFPTQMQFLSYLCNATAHELLLGGDAGKNLIYLREFKRKHLDRWVPDFLDRVAAETRLEEYRVLANLAHAGLEMLDNLVA